MFYLCLVWIPAGVYAELVSVSDDGSRLTLFRRSELVSESNQLRILSFMTGSIAFALDDDSGYMELIKLKFQTNSTPT